MKDDNEKKDDQGEGVKGASASHLYGLRRKKPKKSHFNEKVTAPSKRSSEKLNTFKESSSSTSSKKKKKSRKRKSKHSHHHKHSAKRRKDRGIGSHQDSVDCSITNENPDHEAIRRNPGVVFLNIKEEVIDPEYERVLLCAEVDDDEEDPSQHVAFQEAEEEDEFLPQTDDDEDEDPDHVMEKGLQFNDIDGMPLIMEVKEEVEDQGYAVVDQWNEATITDLQEDEMSVPFTQEIVSSNIKMEITEEDDQASNDYTYPLGLPSTSSLLKVFVHKLNFWLFHCPLCSSQQVFLHRIWLKQHLEENFHRENGKISKDAEELLQDLIQSDTENVCPVETCQLHVQGGIEEFCKHLLSDHIDSFQDIKKLGQINLFCQEKDVDKDTEYRFTVQLNGKWHTFHRTKISSNIHTSIKEESEFFPNSKIVDPPKMKMTVKLSKAPVTIKPAPPTTTTCLSQVAPRDSSKFCFDGITYYKCPICPTLTVFFDVLCLKTHMIRKSHQLSSVCRVLKEIGVQHPTYTCPIVDCNEDFGKSQKKQIKHIITEHPEKYDRLNRLMDGGYQNFQSISGMDVNIGTLNLGISNPQTINVTCKPGGKLPTLKPKPPDVSTYENQIILSQQNSSLLNSSLQATSKSTTFTTIKSTSVPKTTHYIFPSSQTVRQILDSKIINKLKVPPESQNSTKQNDVTDNITQIEMNNGKNGTTLSVSDPDLKNTEIINYQHKMRIQSPGLGPPVIQKPRAICYKCGLNVLTNIGLVSHLFNDHCKLICKICSFSCESLKVDNSIIDHMKNVHMLGSDEVEANISQSFPDISLIVGIPKLDGLSCITPKKFIIDELVMHYSLVHVSSHKHKFEDDRIVRKVKREGDEFWIEILVGQKSSEVDGAKPNSEVDITENKIVHAEDTIRMQSTSINEEIASSIQSLASNDVEANIPAKPEHNQNQIDTVIVAGQDSNSSIQSDMAIGRQSDLELVSPSSGYNSPIRKWLIQESIKEIRLEKVPFTNSLHCLRCDVTASTNRGFLLHIFSCHSIDVCKLCFFDLSNTSAKGVRGHLSTHSEYDRKLAIEDYLTLSCPEFMQLLGIPSLDQLCNITRDRIIFTFRVVWYRMAQVAYDTKSKSIMQKNVTINTTPPKAGSPDIILFFRNKHGTVIQVDKECDREVIETSTERSTRVPCYVALPTNSQKETTTTPTSESESNETSSTKIDMTELETTRQFVEGKDFTIFLQGNDRVFKCLKCTRAYWNKCKMRRHLKVHLNIRNYQCHLCQKSFHYNYHLKAHMNIHNNSRPYKCTKCSKSYNNSGSLSWHVRQCHGLLNLSKNKITKVACQVCFIQIRQELYHEHLRERHGVSVAYQYWKSKADDRVLEGTSSDVEVKITEGQKIEEEDATEDDFPWRGELIVDEGDAEDEPDNYDLAPATAQNVFAMENENEDKESSSPEKYNRQEVFQCTFCNTVYANLSDFSMHACSERPNKTSKASVSKHSLQNYTETYTCSKCKRTSLLLETFIDSSHDCALNSVSNFMCEKTYTCKLCQLIFTNLSGVQNHVCEKAETNESEEDDVSVEITEQEEEEEESTQDTDPSADLICPVCNGVYSMTELPYHLSSKHHLNRKVVFELMSPDMQVQNKLIKKTKKI